MISESSPSRSSSSESFEEHKGPEDKYHNKHLRNPDLDLNLISQKAQPKRISKDLHITPEIAAAVVKDYLLPMFDNDGKKLLKRKAKLPGISLSHPTL